MLDQARDEEQETSTEKAFVRKAETTQALEERDQQKLRDQSNRKKSESILQTRCHCVCRDGATLKPLCIHRRCYLKKITQITYPACKKRIFLPV